MACYYREADLGAVTFEPVEQVNRLYVSYLTQPLAVVTPPVELASSLGEDAQFLYIRPTGGFAQFLRDVEALVLNESMRQKVTWFRRDVEDEVLRHNFKSFFREDGAFKVKVQGEPPVFDAEKNAVGAEEATPGKLARCVLELVRVCFGRQEFGAVWRLAQVRLVEVPPCLIQDEPAVESGEQDEQDAEDAEGSASADPDEHEFL